MCAQQKRRREMGMRERQIETDREGRSEREKRQMEMSSILAQSRSPLNLSPTFSILLAFDFFSLSRFISILLFPVLITRIAPMWSTGRQPARPRGRPRPRRPVSVQLAPTCAWRSARCSAQPAAAADTTSDDFCLPLRTAASGPAHRRLHA